MSKGIASYPEHMRPVVVARRMKQYDPDGFNGIGVLAAKAQYDRQNKQPIKVSKPKKAKGAKHVKSVGVPSE